ncbi:MAG: hypothetical protein AAF851_13355 [Myxococcota bacterium]
MAELDALIRDLWKGSGLGELVFRWEHASSGFFEVQLSDGIGEAYASEMSDLDPLAEGMLEGFLGQFAVGGLGCLQTAPGCGKGKFICGSEQVLEGVRRSREASRSHAEILAELLN